MSAEWLAARFESAPYCKSLGIRIESVERDRVRVRVPYKDENSNPGRALHGGVAASTIDIVGQLSAWSDRAEDARLLACTLDLSVTYLAAAIGEDVVATGEVLRRGKEITYTGVDVRNDAGKRIAAGLSTYRILDPDAVPGLSERQRTTAAQTVDELVDDLPEGVRVFMSVPFISRLGLLVDRAYDGRAHLRLPFRADLADSKGALHEGALAALIDTAGAMASWSITGLDFRYKASTVGIHVNYHTLAQGDDVVAHAHNLRRDNEIFLNEVTVSRCYDGRVVATGSVTYRIVVT